MIGDRPLNPVGGGFQSPRSSTNPAIAVKSGQGQPFKTNDPQQDGAPKLGEKLESPTTVGGNKLKNPIKIWSRQSTILPHLIGKTVHIHNGIRFMPVRIVQEMVGHKFGEFSLTRKKSQRQGSGNKKK